MNCGTQTPIASLMKQPPRIITLPVVRNPMSGIVRKRTGYYASRTVDGNRRWVTLNTKDQDIAMQRRDDMYAGFRAAGAVPPTYRGKGKGTPDDLRFIYHIPERWVVRGRGVMVGTFRSEAEAKAARNAQPELAI